jgi:hypothetical protein
MGLWNTLRTLYRDGLAGPRSAGHKGDRSAERPRTRLELEALDQRVLPSTVPNLSGLTMYFNGNSGNTLAIQSVHDQGNGSGTFTGVYVDSHDGVLTPVNGTIALKSTVYHPNLWSSFQYDFGVTFSGSAISNFHFNPRTGIWSED